jgi:hypothetical protein
VTSGRGLGGDVGARFGAGELLHHAFLLARIRLTRMAAERGPILSGACGQDALAEINRPRLLERASAHTPPDA